MTGRVGCYPGSFNPPTIAHLAVAEAAHRQCVLARLDLVVSRVALGKAAPAGPRFEDRIAVLDTIARTRPWLGVRVTEAQLLVDIAAGYDVLVLGADKWAQVVDPAWYDGSVAARDDALARLPEVVVAPRPPWPVPPGRGLLLDETHLAVSATGARTVEPAWMAAEAAAFDARTGAWTDPARYRRGSSRDPRGT
jgi:nicotinate-nucleotide adenylyltransferase